MEKNTQNAEFMLYQPPTNTEALEKVKDFIRFCPVNEYTEDLIEVFMYAMSSELADCNPTKRGSMMFLLQKLNTLVPAIYLLHAHEIN